MAEETKDKEAKGKSVVPAIAMGVLFGAALYVLGAVTAPYVAGVSGPVFAAIGFAGGFVLEFVKQ